MKCLASVLIAVLLSAAVPPLQAQGTGFAVSTSTVVTACHVVRGAASIQIKFWASGNQAAGRQLLCNERHDIAVIGVAVPEGTAILPLAEGAPAQGQPIWVWGYPLGTRIAAEPSLAAGIVSAAGVAEGTFALDVSSAPGSSGGPVLNEQGQVVGVLLGTWNAQQAPTGFKHAASSGTVLALLGGLPRAAATAEMTATTTKPDAGILPGTSVGAVQLGMTPAQVEASLGVPPSTRLSNGWMEWKNRQLWVYFKDGKAFMIDTEDRTLATPAGIRVGSTDTDLIRAYGAPTCSSVRDLRGEAYLGWYYSGLFIFLKGSPRQAFSIRVLDPALAGAVCR